jgi:geranylgeranyl pyrophosphate synthase
LSFFPNPHAVNTRMLTACTATSCGESSVLRAIRDLLNAGGSHLRALFCLDAAVKLGVHEADALTLATICELLHNASLIHDDLLDRASERRGHPTTWAAYDDTVAVCAGDLMLASAFGVIGELGRPEMVKHVLALVHRRTQEVILGQGAENAGSPRTLLEYEQLASGKSSSLLSLPFELALLYSENAGYISMGNNAAHAFAVGYQMVDDLKDYSDDVRNGSLNAVCVALMSGSADVASACSLVSCRAEELLRSSVSDAAGLPMQSGAAMMACAGTMREALSIYRNDPLEQLHHGG